RLSFRPRLNHGERNPTPILIHAHHPHGHDITHRHHFIGAFDITVSHLTDVYQTAVFEADIDECPKINDVEYRSLKLHARLQILELENAFLKYRWRKIIPRIAART